MPGPSLVTYISASRSGDQDRRSLSVSSRDPTQRTTPTRWLPWGMCGYKPCTSQWGTRKRYLEFVCCLIAIYALWRVGEIRLKGIVKRKDDQTVAVPYRRIEAGLGTGYIPSVSFSAVQMWLCSIFVGSGLTKLLEFFCLSRNVKEKHFFGRFVKPGLFVNHVTRICD